MKRNFKAVETRPGTGVIDRPVGSVSFLWLVILGILFYLASILVSLAAEPSVVSDGLPSVSAPLLAKASPPHQSWFHRMFHKPTWSELLEECESPQDVCNVVNRFVGYRTEDLDRWTAAGETWKNGRGDCEDFAILIENLCDKLGFSTTVNLYFPSGLRGEGHAVVVGNWNGEMWMSSNGSFEVVRSIDDVKESVARMYGCSKDEMWGSVLAHADVERRVGKSGGRSVASAQY